MENDIRFTMKQFLGHEVVLSIGGLTTETIGQARKSQVREQIYPGTPLEMIA